MTLKCLGRLTRRFLAVSLTVVTIGLVVLFVLLKFWALDFQLSGYAKLAGGTQARYDISQGERRLMVAVSPGQEPDANAPPFIHGILLRLLTYNPASQTNSAALGKEFVVHVVYSDYDRIYVDAYNRAKQRGIGKSSEGIQSE